MISFLCVRFYFSMIFFQKLIDIDSTLFYIKHIKCMIHIKQKEKMYYETDEESCRDDREGTGTLH